MEENFFERDISWLSFNYRVLQEAKDPTVPILEKLKFVAIFSSNLEEFYRVRVASLRNLIRAGKDNPNPDYVNLLERINNTATAHQQEFGKIFRDELIPQLTEKNIFLISESMLTPSRTRYMRKYVEDNILKYLIPKPIGDNKSVPQLENQRTYFAVRVKENESQKFVNYLLKIPTDYMSRFVVLPGDKNKLLVAQVGDMIRWNLDLVFFKCEIIYCYAIKLSRDAELYLDDDYTGDIVEAIKKSLGKRKTGLPSRFLYDQTMPAFFLSQLQKIFRIEDEDLIPGARYHNSHEFFAFPKPSWGHALSYDDQPPLPVKELEGKDPFEAMRKKDIAMHFPYQSYDYVVKILQKASTDPLVESIDITLYRVADDSKIARALIKAAKNGKKVFVFDEVKARFDEASNLYWGEQLEKAGVKVRYNYKNLKVHTKIFLITRKEDKTRVKYAYLGTGNFNEKTAKIYCDHALLTTDIRYTSEVEKVFKILQGRKTDTAFKHLLVAPFNLRETFDKAIKKEIDAAKKGERAEIVLKMNSLEDKKIISRLYEASNAGVQIRIIVRGICCLIPGVEGMSKNIKITSIVDRYLEHARIYMFYNGGKEDMYIASADWMTRNLSRRVEVGFPIYDPEIKAEFNKLMALQLRDNTKARSINKKQSNPYKRSTARRKIRAQYAIYKLLGKKAN